MLGDREAAEQAARPADERVTTAGACGEEKL
jgi:hypothetical protein